MEPKAIQDEMGETFDDYGRMSAKLGLELAFTNAGIQTFVMQNFVDPPTEIVDKNEVQIWKITHNGVDTHPVHFHLFEVQVLNRVGWDGFIYLPDPNELGWKDTLRVSPLEDTVVALRPAQINLPYAVPDSIRPLNPAFPLGATSADGAGFSDLDPVTGQPPVPPTVNEMKNFAWEYLWHCHILSHEESDMMRPIMYQFIPTSMLWSYTSGLAALYAFNGYDNSLGYRYYGPYAGWTATSYQRNPDDTAKMLWSSTSGQAALWTLNANGDRVSYKLYGPYGGWTANSYQRLSDGTARMLWINEAGLAALWTLDANDSRVSYRYYGPYSGWKATSYFRNWDGSGRMLWSRSDGLAALWTLDSNDNMVSYKYYGPYATWSATSYYRNSDGTGRMLWSRTDGLAALWTLDSNDNRVSYKNYGPYPGWTATSYD